MFTGPRGTGKTSTARILAKALNCEHGPTENPCGHCVNCERITNGTSMDVFEIDAASNNGVDSVREIIKNASERSLDGKYKVLIIDECHALSNQAWQAFLKCIEEPPTYTIFIFCKYFLIFIIGCTLGVIHNISA